MAESSPMNGGDGKHSYAKNSTIQRDKLVASQKVIEEALENNLDLKTILSGSTTFRIADLGCSVGPNTFIAMQTVTESVQDIYHSLVQSKSKNIDFHVFFNDQTTNDFNTLFSSLPPERKYFAAGVPGSFYERLFPLASIHIALSSNALNWLSNVPKEVETKGSPAWNKGRIYYTGASDEVVKFYKQQFAEDMENFLSARAHEVVKGGMVVIVMPGVCDEVLAHDGGLVFSLIGNIIMDMVKEGILEEDQVDSFNIPVVYPSSKEITKLVEENGCFSIVKMQSRSTPGSIDVGSAIKHARAALEGTFTQHFGSNLVDEIFERAIKRTTELSEMFSSANDFGVQLLVVLKQK